MKKYYLLLIMGIFLLSSQVASATSRCCSQHKGVSHCDTSIGRQVCNDGAYSPSYGSSCRCQCDHCIGDPPTPPRITPMDKWDIISKISSVKNDYPDHHQGFRESLIYDILELTDGDFIDTIGYFVYKMLPDISESTTSEISKTEVIHYVPPELLPKKILDGYCWTNSLATNRTDAWRCMNDNSILDPCFNLPQSEKIICPNNPADKNDDLMLNLTKPLPKTDPQSNEFQSGEYVWYIELQDGSYCIPIIGASALVGNDRANFMCESEEYIMGKLSSGSVWIAKKAILSMPDQQSSDFTIKSSKEVSIKKVWE